MPYSGITLTSCLSQLFGASRAKALTPATSHRVSTPVPLIAQISAAGLIAASAGFGAYYAWTAGHHHGPVLGVLMVTMALALELAKPLSLAAAFDFFCSWRFIRGAAMLLLAAVAVAYSLTAELTLMAMTRTDAAAGRLAQADAAAKAETRYANAKAALNALPAVTRPAEALQADIDAIDRTPGIMIDGVPCGGTLNGKVTRAHCPQRSALAAELATAKEQQRLLAEMAEAEQAKMAAGAVVAGDPGASALSTYLAAVGIVVPAALLTEWLVLVGVLALELGSALALVMVQAASKQAAPLPVVHTPAVPVVQPRGDSPEGAASSDRAEVKKRILKHLKAQGGSQVSSERGLAKLIGTSKPTARRALQSLVLAGVVAAEVTRNGTVLRLMG